MLAFIKDNNKLIVNTQIHDSERDELLRYISGLKNINFHKLYDIDGNISGIAFYKDESNIPIVSANQELPAILSFEIIDLEGKIITLNDTNSIDLVCKNSSYIFFTKEKEDFTFSDNRFNVVLTSDDMRLEPGDYEIEIECITNTYQEIIPVILKVIGVD